MSLDSASQPMTSRSNLDVMGRRRDAGQRGSSRKVVGKVSERTISGAWLLR
jgi:hypothetical protein